MVKPLALDLCAGLGGWTRGLLDAGWDVIGVDTEDMGGYPGKLVIADVRQFHVKSGARIGLVVASPPCQEFSYRSFPFKRCRYLRDNVPPDTSIWRACERIAREVGAPLVLENVRGAVRYMGKAAARFGPFYLWGDVPALIPCGKGVEKGFGRQKEKTCPTDNSGAFGGQAYHVKFRWAEQPGIKTMKKEFSQAYEQKKVSSKSQIRKQWSAKVAMIPYPLARYIGEYFISSQSPF